jgi:hypothetical protein
MDRRDPTNYVTEICPNCGQYTQRLMLSQDPPIHCDTGKVQCEDEVIFDL